MPTEKNIWINPIGGLGDMLMVSGALKQAFKKDPSRKFNIVRRHRFMCFFENHPAVNKIDFPSKDVKEFITPVFWNTDDDEVVKVGPGLNRPYQIIARKIGLETPVEEILYYPGEIPEDPLLHNLIPWKKKNVVICPTSDSPRKTMSIYKWHSLIQKLLEREDILVLQVGKNDDIPLKGVYNLVGLTDFPQLFSLLEKCDLVITHDNLIMHSAYMMGTKTVVIWGPTYPDVYGYNTHTHIISPSECPDRKICIGNESKINYNLNCNYNDEDHCMAQFDLDSVIKKIYSLI